MSKQLTFLIYFATIRNEQIRVQKKRFSGVLWVITSHGPTATAFNFLITAWLSKTVKDIGKKTFIIK
jgi:hypothetical protein